MMEQLKVLFAIHVSLSRTGKLLILNDFLTEQDSIAYKLKGFHLNFVFCKKFHWLIIPVPLKLPLSHVLMC